MSIAPGTRLGPYEVVARLGAGGMGEVYRAKDARLKRDVAVKVLPESLSTDPDRLRRFELEAETAGRLNHPNILAIYDIGVHDGAPYVVSELLEGETLRDRLSAGALTVRRSLEYARDLASGLAAAHEKGIVHRDLKPENVFVTSDGRVKILDFGLAKLTQPEVAASGTTSLPTAAGTEPGVVLGTAGYMSPEQVRGAAVDHRSDIFSFGAILFEMLSGKRAFRGESAIETMSAILKEEPPEIAETGRSVPPGLERIVRHCLEKNPALRFQSARDLAFDVESLSETSAVATRVLPSQHVRRPALLPVLAGVVMLGIVAAGAYLIGNRTSRARFPAFQRLTFQNGNVFFARFAPDGQTIVYSAAWDGAPYHLFSTRPGGAESRSLGLPPAYILSISRDGEMAVVLNPTGALGVGTLARLPLAGGAPRAVLQDVRLASWAPDGKSLAVTRLVGGRQRVEYPVGKTLYETEGFVNDLRISPDGNRLAIEETLARGYTGGTGWIGFLDRAGKRTTLYTGWVRNCGLGWSPDGKEVWFATPDQSGAFRDVLASSRPGDTRMLMRVPGPFTLHDVSREGRLLFTRETARQNARSGIVGEKTERTLSWLDESIVADLSRDGRTLLFSEIGGGGGARGAVYLRPTSGAEAVRLGEGFALALSPDANWALTMNVGTPPRLILLPTGVGQPKSLPVAGFESYYFARWLPDGKRIFFDANLPGRPVRCHIIDPDGGAPRAIGPEGAACWASSPDGKLLAVTAAEQPLSLYPVDGGGSPKSVSGWPPGATPIQWSTDGSSLFYVQNADIPGEIRRFELATGRTQSWQQLLPADLAGVQAITSPLITADGRAYAYTFARLLGDLYMTSEVK
jgi:eukaryotic-like serine/threonine-protein kinase